MPYPSFDKDLSSKTLEQISSIFANAVMLICFNEIRGNAALALIARYVLENPNGDVFEQMRIRFELVPLKTDKEITSDEFAVLLWKIQNLSNFGLHSWKLGGYEIDLDIFIGKIRKFAMRKLK